MTSTKKLSLLVASAIAAIILISIGLVANQPTNTASPAPSVTSLNNMVMIKNYAFAPASITVKVGTTVSWTNQDDVHHTITVDSGTGPQSALIGKGEGYKYQFTKPGTYTYHCEPHTSMHGSVIVVK